MNATPPARVWLILPAWREAERIEHFAASLFPALAGAALPVTVQIVDDGSPAPLAQNLAKRCEEWRVHWPFVRPLHLLPRHLGKGGAIYAGWDLACVEGAAWLAFCDADGSIDAGEIIRLLRIGIATTPPACTCASRHLSASVAQWGSPLRRILSRLFSAWVRAHTGLNIRDSQCGAKLLPAATYQAARTVLREHRFGFDPELLLACQQLGTPLHELPIRWVAQAGSRLNLTRDGWAMLRAVYLLPKRFF